MASDVIHSAAPIFPGAALMDPPVATIKDTPEEERDFQKLITLRNEIYTWHHPRFKPPSISRPAPAPAPAPEPAIVLLPPPPPPPLSTVDKSSTTKPASLAARWKKHLPPSPAKSQIDGVLLTKSDVLIKAETTLKRQRIEQDVKHQLEQRKHEMRLGLEVKDGRAVTEEDVDLETAISKAGIQLKPVERPEDPASVNKLKCFFGDKVAESSRLNGAADSFVPRSAMPSLEDAPQPRTVESLRERERRPPTQPPSYRREGVPTTPQASQSDDVPSPQPKYSATSQVRSPAAPQPVRPANMARVESADRINELESAERASQPPPIQPPQVPPKRARPSPEPYIKQEPIASLFSRDEYAKRPPSSERVPGRPSSREGGYHNRPPPPLPPAAYHYALDTPIHDYYHQPPPPLPPAGRPGYEQYPYREDAYAYPPPPPPPPPPPHPPALDYRRPYPYAPPPVASPYYPSPRPVYDDYPPVRYSSRPPVSSRQPSVRRSASPPGTYGRRRDSRSASPSRRGRRMSPEGDNNPGPMNLRPPAGSPIPLIARRTRPVVGGASAVARNLNEDERAEPAPYRGPEPPATEYPYPPRDRVFYDVRESYYSLPPPPARYPDEQFLPPPPRPESAMLRRDADYRGYRERDYPGPSQARPPVPLGTPYPPPQEYARASSRAPMAPPSDALDYPPRAADYFSRPDPRDLGGRASVRPDERGYLPPPRQLSVRPDVPEYYSDRSYRAGSVRPELERERYSMPPPPVMPPPPPAGYPYGEGGYRYRS